MFYGRVDVYWPDRPMESYRLNKETVAVGRSTGNDIVLDTTTISRYHVIFTFNDEQALLEDLESVNGTYVDSFRLNPHEPFVLRGGEEIQIGEVRLIYHPPDALERTAPEDTTQRVIISRPSYRVELDGPDMAVAPGAHVQATLNIENIGEEADRYFVEIDGLPKGWARADQVEVPLEPGEERQVLINFKPLRRSESRPGEHPFVVRVRSKSRPAETVDAQTSLHVLPFSGFGMALEESVIADGTGFKLYLHNQGNAPLPLTIQGTDKTGELVFALPGGTLRLDAGERRTLSGTIRPRRPRWFGAERAHEFAVVAQAHDASGFVAAVPGKYVAQGRLPGWAPVLAIPVIALVALFVIGFALLLVGGGGDDDRNVVPEIHTLDVSQPEVPLGESVIVSWDVTDADNASLTAQSVRGQRQFPVDPDSGEFPVTFDQTGIYTLILEARNGDASSTLTTRVDVRPKVTLSLTVLSGTELVRNVQHQVRVRWSVAGAKEYDGGYNIWLESSHQDGALFVPPMPLTGEQNVSIVLSNDASEWLVTLYAEGEDQVVASVTQKLAVVYPICELKAQKTIVRSGPGEAYPAILPPQPANNEPGTTLSYSPVARDPSGEWLRVPVSINALRLGWVRRDDFECTNFDPERLLITADYPPPPEDVSPDDTDSTTGEEDIVETDVPLPTPTPAASPTPTAAS